jgi:hypothetical protein
VPRPKIAETEIVTVRLTQEQAARIRHLARVEDRLFSGQLRVIVRRGLIECAATEPSPATERERADD